MKTQVKVGLVLLSTFAIGLVLGALFHGAVMRNRIKDRAFRMRTPEGFIERMEEDLNMDASQRTEAQAIFLKHHERMERLREETMVEFDSLWQELEAILTEEQRHILAERRPPRDKGGRGPGMPPRGRPPFKPDGKPPDRPPPKPPDGPHFP